MIMIRSIAHLCRIRHTTGIISEARMNSRVDTRSRINSRSRFIGGAAIARNRNRSRRTCGMIMVWSFHQS